MSERKSVWLTYAWEDNTNRDVDFIAQELMSAGLEVKLDRWNLTAGKRLWEQIESFIQDPVKSDGWLLYATQASLGSEPCKEEFAYALDRALQTRGGDFPVIALFPASVEKSLIPAGIRTRLFVSITDPDWKERIITAIEGRPPSIPRPQVQPYALTIHKQGEEGYVIEVRPRAGTWSPFFAAIPVEEKDHVSPSLGHGASKHIPRAVILFGLSTGPSKDGRWWVVSANNEASPTQSYHVFCKALPSRLSFGVLGGQPAFEVTLPLTAVT